MLPLAAQPAVHCSTTRTMSRVGFPGISDPPHRLRYVPMPASRRSLLLTGDVHVACCTRWPYGLRYVPVSGAEVALQDGFDDPGAPQMISSGPDWRHPSVEPYQAAPWQGCCSSQNTLNLLRGVGCTVRRIAPFRQLPAWTAGRVESG